MGAGELSGKLDKMMGVTYDGLLSHPEGVTNYTPSCLVLWKPGYVAVVVGYMDWACGDFIYHVFNLSFSSWNQEVRSKRCNRTKKN